MEQELQLSHATTFGIGVMEKNMHASGDVFVNPTIVMPGFPIVVNMSQPRETGVETETYCGGINRQNKLMQIYCPYKLRSRKENLWERSKLSVNISKLMCTFAC